MALEFPYKLITPNCPDGMTFSSLDSLLRFLADNVGNVEIFIKYPI